MGTSHGDFVKYPRTPHLFGSTGTADDKRLNQAASLAFLADSSLIVEEKLDGTNVGIHFSSPGELVLQCRGHLITEGMHPQYDLFKQWATVKAPVFEQRLQQRYILFGEWLYARHSIGYQALSHYFYEFDIYDKHEETFLDLPQRLELLRGTGICTVPVLSRGPLNEAGLRDLLGLSQFDSTFAHPSTGRSDKLMEGLYLRTEHAGVVTGRAKWVRPEFIEKIQQSTHWQHHPMVPNQLAKGVDIWN